MSSPERPLRADARRNRARVLAAAREAFADAGFAVPLDVIAERAGVGPGTVYRHFPSKEALFAAVTEERVGELVALARAGAASGDPGAALDAFLARVAEEAVVKRDLPDALDGGAAAVRPDVRAAVAVLLTAARDAGAVRPGIEVDDLLALLKGLLHAVRDSRDPGLPRRMLAVVRDGLRPPFDRYRILPETDPPAGSGR